MLTPRIVIESFVYTRKEPWVIGLGTGRAADKIIEAFSKLSIRENCTFISTSQRTREYAKYLHLNLRPFDPKIKIDVTFDGADEIVYPFSSYTKEKFFIKGYGGALFKEKIVHLCSELVIIVAGKEKLVPFLGYREVLPIEIVPAAFQFLKENIVDFPVRLRMRSSDIGDFPFVTDNNNHILDGIVKTIQSPRKLDEKLCKLPGVISTGIFTNEGNRGIDHTPVYKAAILNDNDYPHILE